MTTPSGYIFDGMELDAYVAEKPGCYPGVSFKYRPVLTQNRAVTMQLIIKADARRGEELAAELVERQVISWDLSAKLYADSIDPEPVPIKAAHILRLHPTLFNCIYRIILGDVAGDVKPADTATAESGA